MKYILTLIFLITFSACFGSRSLPDPYPSNKNAEILKPVIEKPDTSEKVVEKPTEGNNSKENNKPTIVEKPDTSFIISNEPENFTTNTFNIVVLLPFNTQLNNFDYSDDKINSKSKIALEFYNGMLVALREMKRDGLSFSVKVYDTKIDRYRTESLLKSLEYEPIDLIIGPAFSKCLKVAADWAKLHKTYLISPIATNIDFVENNPYFVSVNPSGTAHNEALMRFLMGKSNLKKVNIVTNSNNGKDIELAKEIEAIAQTYVNPTFGITDSFRVNMIYDTNELEIKSRKELEKTQEISLLESYLDENETNYIIVASYNELFANDVVRRLSLLKSKYDINLIGMPNWVNFRNINIDMLNDLGFTCTSATYENDNDVMQSVFNQNYKANVGSKPTTFSKKGYDTVKYITTVMNRIGTNLELSFQQPEQVYSGFFMNFNLQPVYNDSSSIQYFGNKALHILQFEDYNFQKVQ